MTWLRTMCNRAQTPFEAVLGLCPQLLGPHRDFYATVWNDATVSPRLLELCRLRIALLHDCHAEVVIRHIATGVTSEEVAALERWPSAGFGAVECAALTLADKIPWQVRDITDADVATLRTHLTDAQVVGLVLALTLFDMHCRFRHALGIEPLAAAVAAENIGTVLY